MGVLAEQAVLERANTSISPISQAANCFVPFVLTDCLDWFKKPFRNLTV